MTPLARYIAYIKDNPKHYWFKRKVFGWGWVPATREGFFVLALFIVILGWLTVNFAAIAEPTDPDVFAFFGKVIVWLLFLVVICWKTGEPPKWQWGIPEHKEKE